MSLSQNYLKTARDVYRDAARVPQEGLCCTSSPVWRLPELEIPTRMLEMNYGCGSTVHPRDLVDSPRVAYVGVGGGMELLQFAYFSRRPDSIVGVDPVQEMLEACGRNLREAEQANSWFSRSFVELREGDALSLPLEAESVDVAAQNCLFNIFEISELKTALKEMYRVLRPGGRLVLSDPICQQEIPLALRQDERLRALCLSGAVTLEEYTGLLTETGFGTVEVRARRPYRILSPVQFETPEVIYVESVEVCAIKDPMPADGPCIFTGKTAIYFGESNSFDDGKGHVLSQNQPLAVCDKTARALADLSRSDIFISGSTYFYDGGGCC